MKLEIYKEPETKEEKVVRLCLQTRPSGSIVLVWVDERGCHIRSVITVNPNGTIYRHEHVGGVDSVFQTDNNGRVKIDEEEWL